MKKIWLAIARIQLTVILLLLNVLFFASKKYAANFNNVGESFYLIITGWNLRFLVSIIFLEKLLLGDTCNLKVYYDYLSAVMTGLIEYEKVFYAILKGMTDEVPIENTQEQEIQKTE